MSNPNREQKKGVNAMNIFSRFNVVRNILDS